MADWGDYHLAKGAGWSVFWRIAQADGIGLEIWWADFLGTRVLWRGTQPFAIVPYHRPIKFPDPPEHVFKDGIDPRNGGLGFLALNSWAINGPTAKSDHALKDTDAVVVRTETGTGFGPERMSITAKFECGWYQYVHRWEFDRDGNIHPAIAMGGKLNHYGPSKAHVHHMYFRIDLDIQTFPTNLAEEFNHNSFDDIPTAGDQWKLITQQQKLFANPATARKWRVRDTLAKNALGQHKSYDIEVPQTAGPDGFSTGDAWVTVYRGDTVQQGEGVDVHDTALEQTYAKGNLDTINGSDIVLWVAVHSHHEPRDQGEESNHLPYHAAEFSITPRGFEVGEHLPQHPQDHRQPGHG
jgi:Cu2+-containing amine oxidase